MTTRNGIHISGHYVVSINAIYLFIYVLCIKKIERSDRTVFYIVFKTQQPFDNSRSCQLRIDCLIEDE